jgi:hypothetical protein
MESSIMNPEQLDQSAREAAHPPAELTDTLRALWFARAGRWHEAHDLVQYIPDPEGAWIHAHLHREEGDPENAAYWYLRAEHPIPGGGMTTEEEWFILARHFCAHPHHV